MRGGDVEMRRVLDVGLPGDRQRKHQRLESEHVQQRIEPVLIEQHEADQNEPAGEEMRDVEIEPVHLTSLAT